jgi:hypothetical protein
MEWLTGDWVTKRRSAAFVALFALAGIKTALFLSTKPGTISYTPIMNMNRPMIR